MNAGPFNANFFQDAVECPRHIPTFIGRSEFCCEYQIEVVLLTVIDHFEEENLLDGNVVIMKGSRNLERIKMAATGRESYAVYNLGIMDLNSRCWNELCHARTFLQYLRFSENSDSTLVAPNSFNTSSDKTSEK